MGKFLMNYFDEIKRSMKFISRSKKTLFLGQSVSVPGNLIFKTLEGVSEQKKLELPVFEETQLGLSIGLSLQGYIPVSCYPRFDFFILSFNQLVNHLDKMNKISSNEFKDEIFPILITLLTALLIFLLLYPRIFVPTPIKNISRYFFPFVE